MLDAKIPEQHSAVWTAEAEIWRGIPFVWKRWTLTREDSGHLHAFRWTASRIAQATA